MWASTKLALRVHRQLQQRSKYLSCLVIGAVPVDWTGKQVSADTCFPVQSTGTAPITKQLKYFERCCNCLCTLSANFVEAHIDTGQALVFLSKSTGYCTNNETTQV